MVRRTAGRGDADKAGERNMFSRCGGAFILGAVGMSLGYLFIFMSRTEVGIVVGAALMALTTYLVWEYISGGVDLPGDRRAAANDQNVMPGRMYAPRTSKSGLPIRTR